MTEYEVELLTALEGMRAALEALVSEVHDVGKDILLLKNSLEAQTAELREQRFKDDA